MKRNFPNPKNIIAVQKIPEKGYDLIYEAKSRVIPKAFGTEVEAEVSALKFLITLKSDKGSNIKRDSLF
jgi:hypothetical protein